MNKTFVSDIDATHLQRFVIIQQWP